MHPPPILPFCLLFLTVPPINHSSLFHPSNPFPFYRCYSLQTSHSTIPISHPHYRCREPPLQTLLFVAIPVRWRWLFLWVIFVTKTNTILFAVISMTKMDDFVRDNLYDEDKDICSTFFEVCFPLTDLRFLCVVLLFSLLFIVCDSFSNFEHWSLPNFSWVL